MEQSILRVSPGISDKLRKIVFLSILLPIYLSVFVGLVVGVVFSVVYLNWWKLIYPFLLRILPPLIFVYIVLLGVYAFAVLVRTKQVYRQLLQLENQGIGTGAELLQFINSYSSLPFYSASVSFLIWIIAGILSYVIIRVGEISSERVALFFLLNIVFLALPVSQIIYYYLEREFAKIFKIEGKIREKIYFSPTISVKFKILIAFISYALFVAFLVSSIFIENHIRQLRYSEAKQVFDDFVRGESIPGTVPFEIGILDSEHPFIDKVIISSMKEKLSIGENILFDYVSPGAFVFFASQNVIKGLYLPLKWIDDEFKKLFLSLFGILAVIILVVIYAFYSSLVSYISQALDLIDSKNLVVTNDEFFKISIENNYTHGMVEILSSRCDDFSSRIGKVLSKIFSDSISLRGQINSLINDLKLIRINSERIIAMSGKEIETLEVLTFEASSSSSEEVLDIIKELRDLRGKLSSVSSKFQKIYDILKGGPKRVLTLSQDEVGSRIGTQVEKKFQILISSFEMFKKSLDELSESVKISKDTFEDLEEKFRDIESLRSEIDRLKKRLVILSMNISISSAKITQTEVAGEFSTFSKQLSNLISEDVKRIESGTKEIISLINEIRRKLEILLGDNAIADKIESVKAYAGKVDDILEDFMSYLNQLGGYVSNTKKTFSEVSRLVSEFESKFSDIANASEDIKGVVAEIIPSVDNIFSKLEKVSQSIRELESRYERFSSEYRMIISRYNGIVRDMRVSLEGIREESRKIILAVDKLEQDLNNIRILVDKTISYTESVMKESSSEM